MKLQEIINESDVMVPNAYSESDKISWLNSINQDFFNVVKIPLVEIFITTSSDEYTLTGDVRSKNIDLVQVGFAKYMSILDDNVQPEQNYWMFEDNSKKLSLHPAPYRTGLQGKVRYHQIATSTFVVGDLTASPDAPSEYHWAYVLGLCSRLAMAMEDAAMASNYENDYREYLNMAASHYKGEWKNDTQTIGGVFARNQR